MKINITCSVEVGKAITASLSALRTMGRDDALFDMEIIHGEVKERKPAKARVCYRAINTLAAQETISRLGVGTIKAVVFSDVVNGTINGQLITKRALHDQRPSFAVSTIERELGQLINSGLIVSQPVAD